MKPDLSVVIVAFNVQKYLINCLRTLFDHHKDVKMEVFVVDNHSSDGSLLQVQNEFPQVRLLRNDENHGFAKACNQAIAVAASPYILLLNPDTEFHGPVIRELIAFLNESKETGVVGPRLLNSDESLQGSARGFPNVWTAFFGRSSFLTKLFPENRMSRVNVPALQAGLMQPVEVDWVSGAAMLVRVDAVKQVGLLDESFFLFWEDADWCYRMKQSGWKVYYYPQVDLVHHVGKSVDSQRLRSVIEFHRSAYRWYRKYRVDESWSLNNLIAILGLNVRTVLQLARVCFTSSLSMRARSNR